MSRPEEELLGILAGCGVDFTASLPCEKIKVLLELLARRFPHLPLTREEEGVGICAGAALAGRRPALFVQSSGIGNMVNALLSLTQFYELPLALFVSRRGVYRERIAAQLPMGVRLPAILAGAGIACTEIDGPDGLAAVERELPRVYAAGRIHAFLLSPAIWEGSECRGEGMPPFGRCRAAAAAGAEPLGAEGGGAACVGAAGPTSASKLAGRAQIPLAPPLPKGETGGFSSALTRFDILKLAAPWLAGKAVVCNLGIPAKELYAIGHQPSNFYMLGSMGMVTPIGLGVALCSHREVVVIDGDGSLLMNPGTLAVAAAAAPGNLTILAIDNGAYGSTGSQPTLAATCVDLEAVARGFGFTNTVRTAGGAGLLAAPAGSGAGPRFIHALAVPGNADVPNIPLDHLENKRQVTQFLAAGR